MYFLPDINKSSALREWRRIAVACSCLLLTLTSFTIFAADEYSAGLEAYIKGDYQSAQKSWLQAAKKSNVRAMFNLGLLHDQGKLSNSDPDKAARWFQLAGQEGYAPADFHYANRLIEQRGQQELIIGLLQRAAGNGYWPAQKKLKELGGSGTIAAAAAAAADSPAPSVPVGTEPKSRQSVDYLSEAWIKDRSVRDWTIQILAFQDEAKVKEFIDTHRLHQRAAYFSEKNNGQTLFKLIYGAFANKDMAAKARAELTPALKEHGPWLRTIASVQKVIAQK
jgi:septal ring-binding cell division protein DamX